MSDQFNSQPIWHSPAAVRCVYSDASDTGYGGYTVEHGMHVAQGHWLPDEAVQSSTWRELVAVGRVLEAVAHKLSYLRVCWFTDNQNVVRILQVGSAKSHIQVEALKVFKACIQYNIRLEPEWIPREKNELADYVSRIVDYDDWQLDPAVFAMLNALWGPYSVDRFASSYNTQLVRFNNLNHLRVEPSWKYMMVFLCAVYSTSYSTERECVCCRELEDVLCILSQESDRLTCIVDHPEFASLLKPASASCCISWNFAMRGERIPLHLERNPFIVLVRCTEATTNGTENTHL